MIRIKLPLKKKKQKTGLCADRKCLVKREKLIMGWTRVIWSHHFMGNRWGNSGNNGRLYFWGAPNSLQMVTAAMKLKDAYFLEEKL